MTSPELRDLLDRTLRGTAPHVEKMTVAAAVVSELLRQHGMEATLVGGGAIEFYAPGVYSTTDLDFVVEGRTRDDIDDVLRAFGFERRGRHWVLDELFVEVPGNWMSDPVEVVKVGPLLLRVVRREIVLADRIIGFKHWRATGYGAQALALLEVLGESIDERLLRERLRAEDAVDAFEALRTLARSQRDVGAIELDTVLQSLHKPRGPDGRS
ncbi:MAG: hypothetical protein ACT4OZ_15160 [Gemmatimonadota bacterium]